MKKNKKAKIVALVLTVALLVAAIPLALLPAKATITKNESWSTSGTTLTINNAEDLWAFADLLNSGTTFAGQTVKLAADITVNEDWDAFGDKTPADQWPLNTQNQHFAGTFDGQGHTISGLYAVATGTNGFGLFGDVAKGTVATVKNLTIVNSRIVNEDGARTGGIFGEIEAESSERILDDYYVNTTKGVIDWVHLNINVVANGAHTGGSNGVGGFVGRNCADVSITNSSFDGQVTSPSRGVAAYVGATYPAQVKYDHDGDGATENVTANCYKTNTLIANCMAEGTVEVPNGGIDRFAGALVGYANSHTDQFVIKNVASTMSFAGETAEGKTNAIGYLVGGTFTDSSTYRNGTTLDRQTWTYENVFYEKTSGLSLSYCAKPSNNQKQNGMPQDIANLGQYIESSMGQSITLKSDLALHIFATVIDPDAMVTINGEPAQGISVGGWMNRYTVDGLLPQQMTDTVTIRITQSVGSHTFVTTKSTSIRNYCRSFFKSDDASKPEKTLLADLLRYGAMTQEYANYNTTSLATQNIDLSGYGTAFEVESIPTYYAKTGTASADYDVNAAALMLGNSLAMYLRFQAEDISGLSLVVTLNGRTKTYGESDFVSLGNSQYMIAHNNIGAHEMNIPLTATLKKSGAQVGSALTYSIADYVKGFLWQNEPEEDEPIVTPGISLKPGSIGSTNIDPALKRQMDLISAMYVYGLSAEAYNDSTRRVIIDGYTSDYAIVYDDTASAGVVAIAHQLSKDIAEKTGVTLPVIKDTEAEREKEIILGYVDGRDASVDELSKLVAEDQNGYRMSVVDQKIVIATKSENLLSYASERFVAALTTHGGITWSVPLTYLELMDAPTYASSATITLTPYYAGNNNHTLVYTSTSTDFTTEYAAYIQQLKDNGFVEYTTNSIAGKNSFGTYTKTTDGYNTVVYTMHYPNSKEMRVTYGPLEYLPSQKPISAEEAGKAAVPSIILNGMETTNCGAPGLSLVIQLVDGSFFLVDGGNADQKVTTHEKDENGAWVSTENVQTQQAKALYNLLVSKTPSGTKPVIAGWFMTHAHGDHMGLSKKFLEDYHAKLEVRMVAYNFPDFDTITITKESATSMGTLVDSFEQRIHSYYPDADVWVMHTGQKAYLPGCEIEVMFTPEDYYGMYDHATDLFEWGNHTCSAIRMTFDGGMTFVILGDCEYTLLQKMTNNYDASYLQSDIMQLTHHGLNGAYTDFYKAVDPKICLWPNSEYNFETEEKLLGNENGSGAYEIFGYVYGGDMTNYVYANWWIRNTQWTRGEETGDRVHYAVSNTNDRVVWQNEDIVLTPDEPVTTLPLPLK